MSGKTSAASNKIPGCHRGCAAQEFLPQFIFPRQSIGLIPHSQAGRLLILFGESIEEGLSSSGIQRVDWKTRMQLEKPTTILWSVQINASMNRD
jgi:hypothetical protein